MPRILEHISHPRVLSQALRKCDHIFQQASVKMPHLSTLKMETVAFIHVKLQKCYNILHYQISCFY